jgi:hypothetical protein
LVRAEAPVLVALVVVATVVAGRAVAARVAKTVARTVARRAIAARVKRDHRGGKPLSRPGLLPGCGAACLRRSGAKALHAANMAACRRSATKSR